MTRRTTIADVAAAAGLSKTTVSMVLNDRPGTRLSPETAERVRAFVRAEYGAELPNEEVAFLALHIARAAPE